MMPTIRAVLFLVPVLTTTLATADKPGDPSHQQAVMKDLFAVITLNGQHCEQVIDYEQIAAMQYVAICQNGKRYRIGVTPEGRVETSEHDADAPAQ